MAFDQIYPPSDPHLHTGMLVATLVNLLGGGKRKYKPADFMPKRRTMPEDPGAQERREKSLLDRLFGAMRKRKAD